MESWFVFYPQLHRFFTVSGGWPLILKGITIGPNLPDTILLKTQKFKIFMNMPNHMWYHDVLSLIDDDFCSFAMIWVWHCHGMASNWPVKTQNLLYPNFSGATCQQFKQWPTSWVSQLVSNYLYLELTVCEVFDSIFYFVCPLAAAVSTSSFILLLRRHLSVSRRTLWSCSSPYHFGLFNFGLSLTCHFISVVSLTHPRPDEFDTPEETTFIMFTLR